MFQMNIYVKKHLLFPYFLFFWFSNMNLSDVLILPVSQLETQQMMASHVIYLCSFCSRNWLKIKAQWRVLIRSNDDSW